MIQSAAQLVHSAFSCASDGNGIARLFKRSGDFCVGCVFYTFCFFHN